MTASIETVEEQRRVDVGGRKIDVEVYRPVGETPVPGILMLHEIFGLRDWYRHDARDLAQRGYLVYVPNLYTGGAMRYCIRALVLEAGRKNRAESGPNLEVHRLLDALKADNQCDGKLGMLGACLSGGFVLQMAKRDDMTAPVLYHHSLGLEGSGVPKEESLDTVTRLQAHWAKKDIFCPKARQDKLIDTLGDRLEYFRYDMPHGFRSKSRHMPEAPLVWERTLAFYDKHLKGATE